MFLVAEDHKGGAKAPLIAVRQSSRKLPDVRFLGDKGALGDKGGLSLLSYDPLRPGTQSLDPSNYYSIQFCPV
ncbi:hypothetical protein CCP2SC5_350022 [Azospirillaceae bacterium]